MGSSVVLLNRKLFWGGYALALVVVLLDQWSKFTASASLEYAIPVPVFAFLDMTLHHNTGAAFSFLSEAGGWQRVFFSVVAVVASVGISIWLWRLRSDEKLLGISLALILGGALGNVIDRISLGYVVDFISVHYGQWYFPTFNIADSAITLGAVGLIVDSLFGEKPAETEQGDSTE